MRKNYFKSLMAVAMMAMAGLSLTSCDEIFNEIFDNPVEVEVTPSETSENEVTVTLTSNGASITVNVPSDITDLLGQVKSDIAAKGSAEYTVEVTSEGIEATSGDNTISIPKVAGSDINLKFDKAISTETALTVKAAETESTTPTDAVDKLTITMPAGSTGLDLNLDMPETTVTLKASSGSVVYDEVIAVTAINTLYVESGVTIRNLQVKGGIVIVKEGGKVETNVYAPESNDYVMYQYDNEEGVEPVWVDLKGDSHYVPNVQNEDGSVYLFKNLKVIKGTADYANISLNSYNNPLEKITIAEGAVVLFNYQPTVKEIEGEGDGSATIQFSNWWWNNYDEKLYSNEGNLYNTEKINNITIEEYIPSDVDGKLAYSYLYNTPADAENVTFKMGRIEFRSPETSSSIVKNCKFESPSSYRVVQINAPVQSEEITSYKFSFEACEFNKDCKIGAYVPWDKPKLDENGNEVKQDIYCWWEQQSYWRQSNNLDDVPEANKTVGQTSGSDVWNEDTQQWEKSEGYWIQQSTVWEKIQYEDYHVTVAFNGCKYDGSALTSESDAFNYFSNPGVLFRFEIDGTTYRALWDSENEKYILIPA